MLGEITRINRAYKDTYVTVKVPPQKAKNLQSGDIVSLDPRDQDSRTIKQNSYLWARLGNLNEYLTGGDPDGEMDLYIELLERAGAKVEYIMATEQTAEALKKLFRAMKIIGEAPNGMHSYKCYYGSSTFDTAEMARLLDELTELEYEIYNAEDRNGRQSNYQDA